LLEVSVSKKTVVRYELAPNLPAVEADATLLPQVIMNLIINASEAIGEKSGVIGVSTGTMECDGDHLSNAFFASKDIAKGTYVYVEVADTGCGMDEATKAHIFDPFFTTKFTGRGLGLATVLGLVRGHKGAIELYSEPGKGTTIKVLFPAIQRLPGPLRGEASSPTNWRGSGAVLLVDDEEPVLDVGSMMLEEAGFDVRTARNGREAVEVFRQHKDEVVAVVLDLMMPLMDGEEALRELRRIREDVKIVLSSGYQEQDVTGRVLEMGFAGFLKKPYTAATLIKQLRQALEGDDV
jgi:CheY-like chemotaxis protein